MENIYIEIYVHEGFVKTHLLGWGIETGQSEVNRFEYLIARKTAEVAGAHGSTAFVHNVDSVEALQVRAWLERPDGVPIPAGYGVDEKARRFVSEAIDEVRRQMRREEGKQS